MENQIIEVPVRDLVQRENSRLRYDESDMSELMVSLKQTGLLQAIGVRRVGDSNKYDVVFGNRRVIAAKKLGWKTIPATLALDANTKEKDVVLANLTENIIRVNPSFAEQSFSFQKLIEAGLTKSEIAARLGITVKKVTSFLDATANMPNKYKKRVVHLTPGIRNKKGKIAGDAAILIENQKKHGTLSVAQANKLYEEAIKDGVTVRDVRNAVTIIRKGASVDSAIRKMRTIHTIMVSLNVDKNELEKCGLKEPVALNNFIRERVTAKYPKLLV